MISFSWAWSRKPRPSPSSIRGPIHLREKKKFLLRLDAELYDALEKWAAHELRSVNGQMEYLLQEAARGAGRLKGERETQP
jgi:hypothetical protein